MNTRIWPNLRHGNKHLSINPLPFRPHAVGAHRFFSRPHGSRFPKLAKQAPLRPKTDLKKSMDSGGNREEHQEKPQPERKEPQQTPEPTQWRSSFKFVFFFTVQAYVIAHYIFVHHYEINSPSGPSMLPNMYLSGEWVIISRHHARGRDIKVGDLVCALHPIIPTNYAILKRVIGMPGDFVQVYDGAAEEEDGMISGESARLVKVPKGHCWVAGDNVPFSRDSRLYGPIPLGLVTGKVTWRILPWARFGRMKNTLEEVDEADLVT